MGQKAREPSVKKSVSERAAVVAKKTPGDAFVVGGEVASPVLSCPARMEASPIREIQTPCRMVTGRAGGCARISLFWRHDRLVGGLAQAL